VRDYCWQNLTRLVLPSRSLAGSLCANWANYLREDVHDSCRSGRSPISVTTYTWLLDMYPDQDHEVGGSGRSGGSGWHPETAFGTTLMLLRIARAPRPSDSARAGAKSWSSAPSTQRQVTSAVAQAGLEDG
jgi:hypothetical protein